MATLTAVQPVKNGATAVQTLTSVTNTEVISWVNRGGRSILLLRNSASATSNAILATVSTVNCSHGRGATVTTTLDGAGGSVHQFKILGPFAPGDGFISTDPTRAADGKIDVTLSVSSGTPVMHALVIDIS